MRRRLIFQSLCALLWLASLAGCATDEGEEKKAAQSPIAQAASLNSYADILERSYTALAEKSFAEMDWIDAYRFQNKANQAAKGRIVEPDSPKSRSVAVARDPDIVNAHRIVVSYLRGDALARAPREIAMMQAAYDCWIEDGEESLTELASSACRKQFEEARQSIETLYIEDALDVIEAGHGGAP